MKRKFLFLFSVLLASVAAWAQTATLEPSTNVNAPEKVYVMKSGSGYWMSSYTSPTQSRQKAAAYAFFAVDGMDNAYKIYSLNKQAWLSYTKASGYSNGTNFVKFVPDQASAEPWSAAYVESKQAYQFSPFLNDNNNTVAGKYMQWYGGLNSNPVDNTTTKIGLWQTDAAGDDASAWYLEEVEAPTRVVASLEDLSNDKLYVLKSGRSSSSGNHYLLYHPDAPNHLSSTYGSGHSMDFDISNPNFHFSIYKDGAGKYYFYNIAARKFIGNADANNAAIPLTADVTNPVEIRTSGNSDYGFAFSTNGKGALNAAETTGCHGVVNWTGGYGNFSDLGNLYKIVEVGENESLELGIALTIEAENYFSDGLYSELKDGVTSSEGIASAGVKALVGSLLSDAQGYKKFRVAEYEPYRTVASLQQELKTSSPYNQWENPTGIYLKEGESCVVAVSGIGTDPVGLKIKNWVKNENGSTYSLVNGLNYITATTEGNVFVDYYTDNFESAPNVKVHFINAPVRGYWDKETMTNDDWVKMLEPLNSDSSIIIVRSEHAQLAYPVCAWKQYCPENVDSLMAMYQQVQWAERDMMGLKKYGREAKNRQLYFASTYGFMAATNVGAYCNVGSLGAIMTPDSKTFDFWGVGHEWGHNNQITPGFHWSGCGETTNNIYASWAQIHFTGNPSNLRLEDEVTGIDEYSGMRGGRMQTYFEEALRKGVQWQLQDGPDYHGATPNTKTVDGYDYDGNPIGQVTTTSRNYDHFVKLVPFWQLNLWGTLAGKCPEIIPMVIEGIRTTDNYGSIYNTNGKQQVNWMKLACDSAKLNLLPFFEKAGMLKPIDAYIEDYGAGWNKISEAMINTLKSHVASKGYPDFTEEINYINAHNMHIYRDNQKLQVPATMGAGCTYSNGKVKVMHSQVQNAVAFETYNSKDSLIRITMYGLGSDDAHSYTQVLYPAGAAYIKAVGYDGTREKIYEKKMLNVVYSFIYKGEEKMREEYVCAVGDEYPAITSKFPFGISATKPTGYIQEEDVSDATVIKVVELQENLPFQYAASYGEIDKWYHLRFGAGNAYISHAAGDFIAISTDDRSVEDWDAYQWAFVGNPFDGYKMYNKATGETYILSSSTTMKGNTGAETYAIMTSTPVPEGNNEYWYATASTNRTNGFYLAQKGYEINRLNNRGGKLAYWTDGADGGSTFTVEDVLPMPVRLSTKDKTYYYALKTGRDGEYWYTYDSSDGKIYLGGHSPGLDAQLWFFKGLYQDGKLCVQLYPKADSTKAMSYQNTNSGAGKIFAQVPGTEGWKNTWKFVDTNGAAPYGLRTPGDENYLSNHSGVNYKMGMWTASPADDEGTAIYIYQTIDNIITDMAGNTYESTSFAQVGQLPEPAAFTGVDGYTLSNKCWIDNKFTADIDFGFPVSSESTSTDNWTVMKQGSWEGSVKKWHVVNDGGIDYVKVQTKTATHADVTEWLWAIYPLFDNGAFTFKIKNYATAKYVTANTEVTEDPRGSNKPISLSATPTSFTVESRDAGKMFAYMAGAELNSKHYLTINSTNDTDVFLGSYIGNHSGNDVNFPPISYTASITSAKAATLYTPVAVTIPEGVTAKYVKAGDNIGSTGTLWYTKLNGIIPANTAVVLIGEPATYTFTVTKEAGEQVEGNVLFGYAEYTPVTESEHTATGSDGTVYALANKENGVAFYHYVGANYLAGKAYLDVKELSAGTGVRLFNIFDEETETGIVETVNGNAQTGNEEIYDLTGRRVREARNGLYIVNGQRVIR